MLEKIHSLVCHEKWHVLVFVKHIPVTTLNPAYAIQKGVEFLGLLLQALHDDS